MTAQIKNSVNRFGLTFLVLFAALLWVTGCATNTDPLAGWTFRGFDDYLPSLQRHHYQLDKAITDDYQDFIKKNNLILSDAITGFFEDGTGQYAVKFTVFPPGQNATWNYVLIYDKENKRIKIIKYGYVKYQS